MRISSFVPSRTVRDHKDAPAFETNWKGQHADDGSAKSRRSTLLRLNLRSFKPSQYEQRRPGRREEDRRHAKPDKDDGGTEGGRGERRRGSREPRRARRGGARTETACSLFGPLRSSCRACAKRQARASVRGRERVVCEQACFSPLPACRPAGKTIPPTAHRTGSESESAPPPMGRRSAVT